MTRSLRLIGLVLLLQLAVAGSASAVDKQWINNTALGYAESAQVLGSDGGVVGGLFDQLFVFNTQGPRLTTPVPEPAGAVLAGFAVTLCIARRRANQP